MRTPSEVTVNVRNLAVGGAGVGEVVAQADGNDNLLGITAFVPFTAVGEVISARVTQQKKRHINAELVDVQSAAPERVTPRCMYFTNCGGCTLQHLSYDAQIAGKFSMISGALRAAQLPVKVLDVLQPIVRGEPYGYRRRVSLHIDDSGRVGYYRENSRSVVQVESCDIATAGISELLPELQALGKSVAGKISSLMLEADDSGIIAVMQSPYALSRAAAQLVLDEAKRYFKNVAIHAGGKEIAGSGRQILELPLNHQRTCMLQVPAGQFSQVNWNVNLELIERVVEWAEVQYGTSAIDLYAGAGNFALPLARAGAHVTAVESDKRLVSFGRENAQRNNVIKRLEFFETTVERFLKHTGKGLRADIVIADPPRSGLGPLVRELNFNGKLLFVSCHLPSFVRDVKSLIDTGWEVQAIEPFDMFGQTSHIELLGVLTRSD